MIGFYDTRFDEIEILDIPYNFYVIRDYNNDSTHVEFNPTLLSKSVLGIRQNRKGVREMIQDGLVRLVKVDNAETTQIRTLLIDGKINAAEEIAKRIFEQTRTKLSFNV